MISLALPSCWVFFGENMDREFFRSRNITVALITIPICLLTLGYVYFQYMNMPTQGLDTIRVIDAPAGAPVLNILFVGNSAMMVNDMPGVLANIAATDKAAPVSIHIGRFMKVATLMDGHWARRSKKNPFLSGRWDYVVLQESGSALLSPKQVQKSGTAMIQWVGAAQKAGAAPILFQGWVPKPGSQLSLQEYQGRYNSAEQMQDQVDRIIKGLGEQTGAMVAPVGDYWMACMSQPGAPNLYWSDDAHPGPAGTYLAALVFYRRLTGHGLEHVTYVPPNLSQKDAAFILRCASY